MIFAEVGAIYLHKTTDRFQAKWVINNWMEFNNLECPRVSLDKRTPDVRYFKLK
jgi:hypothetical protein